MKALKEFEIRELGDDLSYERYVQQPMRVIDPVTIHSARLFVRETMKITPTSGATASVEALFNLNHEDAALNASSGTPPTKGVSAFHGTRLVGKVGLTTTVFSRLSVAVGFTLRYDHNPPPRPIPGQPDRRPLRQHFRPLLRQGRHPGRGAPDLHVHLTQPPWAAVQGSLLDLGEADALSLPG